jgi:hypothetical protein
MIGNPSRPWLLVSFVFFLIAFLLLITLFSRFGGVFFEGSRGKPVGASPPGGFSRERAEDVLARYIDAYRNGKAEELVSLYSQSYLRKEGLNYQKAAEEIRGYFKMVEEKNGKIVRWDIIQFKVYSNYALAVCRLKRERGRQSTSVIVLEKEGLEWKVADVFRLRK